MKVDSAIHIKFKLQGKSFSSPEELIIYSEEFLPDITSFLKEWFNENDFVFVKTSGSTGKPKQIQLQKKHMINSAKATGAFFNLFENTSALLCMSAEYIAGKMMLVRAITLGWHLNVVLPTSNPLNGIGKTYDFSAMVPLQLSNSIKKLSKIKKIIIGGGVVSKELLKKIQGLKTAIFVTYGMTETITHIAVKKLNNFDANEGLINKIPSEVEHDQSFHHTEFVSVSHYKILPNVKISTDNRGCLVISASKIATEKVITNDLVKLISETEFEWLGRYDTIINSGGIKLIPEQIEEKLSEIINERFFVTGIPDEKLGEKLVLVIERMVTEDTRSNISTLTQKVKELMTLSKFEEPKEIYFIDNFIETETNKINRKKTVKLLSK